MSLKPIKFQSIKMVCAALVLMLSWCSLGTQGGHLQGGQTQDGQPCHDALALPLKSATLSPNGSLHHEGLNYPPGSFWKVKDTFFGCPCDVTRCIRRCGDFDAEPEDNEEFDESDLELRVAHADDLSSTSVVKILEFFTVVRGHTCNSSLVLEPDVFEEDQHVVLSNGTLLLTARKETMETDQFCFFNENSTEVFIAHCVQTAEEDSGQSGQGGQGGHGNKMYPGLLLGSTTLLLLGFCVY